jgi:hypothetical protein
MMYPYDYDEEIECCMCGKLSYLQYTIEDGHPSGDSYMAIYALYCHDCEPYRKMLERYYKDKKV